MMKTTDTDFFPQESASFAQSIDRLNGKQVAVCGHLRPDGDCIGSTVATVRIMNQLGIDAVGLNRDEVPTNLKVFVENTPLQCAADFLNKELRAIEFVSRLVEHEDLSEERYKRVRMHMIEADEELASLSASSKLNAEWQFLEHLHNIGRRAAEAWLAQNFKQIGQQSTFDLTEFFRSTRIEGEI